MSQRLLTHTFLLACALATASTASAGEARQVVSKAVAPSGAEPACAVALRSSTAGTLHVDVAGRMVDLAPVDNAVDELRVYPDGPASVLVASAGRGDNGPHGSGTLWRVDCKAGAPVALAQVADADFGHAALAADRRTLYFTGADGVFGLDLSTGRSRRLTTAVDAACRKNEFVARDVVVGPLAGDVLPVERGCGYGHAWHAVAMNVRVGASASAGARATPAKPPVASAVAIGAGGWIWLATGRCGDRAAAHLLASEDDGGHWRTLAPKMATPQPVRALIADRTHPGAALLFTASCGSSEHVEPAWVYLTEDGGKTFRPIGVPPGIATGDDGGPAAEQDPIESVAAPDGSLDRIVLFGQSTQVVASEVARWESRDRGRTWTALPPVAASPALQPTEARAPGPDGGASIRPDGVWRWRTAGEAGVRIFPRD